MTDTPWTEGWVKDGTDRWVQTFPDGVMVTLRKEPPGIVSAPGKPPVMGVLDRWHSYPPSGDGLGHCILEDEQRAAWQAHTPEGREEAARFAAMNKAQMDVLAEAERALFGPVQRMRAAVNQEVAKREASEPKRLKIGDAVDLPMLMWRGRQCVVTEETVVPGQHPRDTRRYTLHLAATEEEVVAVCGHCGQPAEAVGTPDTRCQDCLGGIQGEHHICQQCWQAFDHARQRGHLESGNPYVGVERATAEIAVLNARLVQAEAAAEVRGGEWCAKNRAEGRGPCGACAWCCKQAIERAEAAEHRESVLRSIARTEAALALKERAEKAEADVKTCQEVYAAARALFRVEWCVDAHGDFLEDADAAVARLRKAVGL